MNQTWKTIVTIVITAIVVGGGVYYWQEQKTNTLPDQTGTAESAQNQDTQQSAVTPSPSQPEVKSNEVASTQFDTMEKYVELVLDLNTKSQYKTTKPTGYGRIRLGGGEEVNVMIPSGIAPNVFVLAKSGWDVGNVNDTQTFYLEVFGPLGCQSEMDCFEPNVTQFYGPFQGKLKLLVQ